MHRRLVLSVGVSPHALDGKTLFRRIRRNYGDRNVGPSRLVFRLARADTVSSPITSLSLLAQLQVVNFRLSVSSFNAKFSSVLRLIQLPFSRVGISGSFIVATVRSRRSHAIIGFVIRLNRDLKLHYATRKMRSTRALAFLHRVNYSLTRNCRVTHPVTTTTILP